MKSIKNPGRYENCDLGPFLIERVSRAVLILCPGSISVNKKEAAGVADTITSVSSSTVAVHRAPVTQPESGEKSSKN